MFTKPIQDHLGNHFSSKVDMCAHYNITVPSFDSRIHRGWNLEMALTKPKGYRPNGKTYKDHLGNTFESLSAMARHWNIPESTLQRRIMTMKMSIKDALTTTTDEAIYNKHLCYDHLGHKYPSKAAMCQAYNIDKHVYFGRISIGWTIEEALTTPIDFQPANSKAITDHTGQSYKSISSMCKAWNMTRTTYNARIKNGWSVEKALTTPQKEVNIKKQKWTDHNGVEYASLNQMCNAYGITHHTFSTRINKLGWDLEKALTMPNVIYAKECTDYRGRIFPTKNDMAHFYGFPAYMLHGKNSSDEHIEKIITNNFLNNDIIDGITIKKVIQFPYFLVVKDGKEYILHLDAILDIYHNNNFNPIPDSKLKDKSLEIGSCIEFPYYNVTYNNENLIWSYWDIIEYRKNTNFGLSQEKTQQS